MYSSAFFWMKVDGSGIFAVMTFEPLTLEGVMVIEPFFCRSVASVLTFSGVGVLVPVNAFVKMGVLGILQR